MTTAGIFCPQCQVFHPQNDAPAAIPGYCPSCGCSLTELPAASPSEKVDGWFFTRDGKPAGPYSVTELRLLAAVGDIHPTDLVWKAGAGPNPSTMTARTLLSGLAGTTETASHPAAPIPTWAVEQSLSNPKFLRMNEASLPPVVDLAAEPVRQPIKAWAAALIVLALFLGLVGLRSYVESNQPEGLAAGKKDGVKSLTEDDGKQAKTKGKRDAVSTDKSKVVGKEAEKDPGDGANRGGTAKATRPAPQDLLSGRRIPEAPGKLDFSPKNTSKSGTPANAGLAALAHVQCSAGWATFGQVLPAGAAREALKLGELPTQTDVKARWPDGSIRFAIVTARIPRSGVYSLRAVNTSAGAVVAPSLPTLWVAFATGSDGKTEYTVPISARTNGEVWLRGPLVYEERQTEVLRDAKGTPHPFLRLLIDLRTYQDGQARVDLIMENTLNVRGATTEQYTILIGDGKGNVFTSRHIAQHHYLTRWRHTLPLGLQAAQVRPDVEPLFQARALPRFLSSVAAQVNPSAGESFEPLQTGELVQDMSTADPRPELAPYPDATARYLVHRDPRQARHVLLIGDLAGSWPIHLRRADGSFPTSDDVPRLSLEPDPKSSERPLGDLASRGHLVPDAAGQPSLAYVPYLLTGDRYYADELTFWANYALLSAKSSGTNGTRASGLDLFTGHSVSAMAWGLRDLADAAAYLPDSNPLKKHFAQKVDGLLRWLDRYADENPSPLGTLWHEKRPENMTRRSQVWIAPWEQNYLAWSIDHANKQGFAGGLKHRDRIARFQQSLFTSTPNYRREFGAPDLLAIGDRDEAGKITLYRNLAEVFRKNFGDTKDKGVPFAGSHGPGARLMLLVGLENGWPGAREAHAYLWPALGLEVYTDNLPDLAVRAGWALATPAAPPKAGKR